MNRLTDKRRQSRTRPAGGRDGAVLIIALIILASVMISAIGLSMLIINSLQQTRTLDQATVAYYAAETAAEEAIWEVRKSPELDAPPPPAVPDPDDPNDKPVVLTNGAEWSRDVAVEEGDIRLSIPRDSFYEMQLFEPTAQLGNLSGWSLGGESTKTIKFLTVDWDYPQSCDSGGVCPVLFAEWLRWNPLDLDSDPVIADSSGVTVYSKRYMSVPVGPAARIPPSLETGFPDSLLVPTYAYRLRLRAEYGDLRNMVIKAYDEYGQPVDLPGRIKVDAWGDYGGVLQKITVRIPRKSPLSSLFDFAVFSECSLVKGYTITCP